MKMRSTLLATAIASAALLSGCQSGGFGDTLMQSFTISDAEVKQLSNQSCEYYDANSQIAASNSTYAKRLNKIATALGSNIDGQSLNYKVYMTNDVNAWAMANGCVRVYKGLMDKMTDNEVEGVLGHEIGHVALGHSAKAMRVSYAADFAQSALAQFGGETIAALSQSQLGELSKTLVNAQFSQSQESAADNYSYELLKRRNIDVNGLATAFDKLAALGSSDKAGLLDSHPGAKERANAIRARIAADKK